MAVESEIKCLSNNKCFGGYQKVYEHFSNSLQCNMKFGLYIPPSENDDEKFPVLFYLSGGRCTEQNFIKESGFQRYAAYYKIMVVSPDTSPRICGIHGNDDKFSVWNGLSMYVNATQKPLDKHFQMYTYITEELFLLVQNNFPVIQDKISITGHSMGGHGALLCSLLNPGKYKSVSAFAPICNISNTPLLYPILKTLIGEDMETFRKWDPTFLVKNYDGPEMEILIHVGANDEYLIDYVLIDNIMEAANECKDNKIKITFHLVEGYDHGYFFVSSLIEEHFKFHYSKLSS